MELLHLLSVVVVCCVLQQIRAATNCCPGIPRCFTDDPPSFIFPVPQCPEDLGIVMTVYTRDDPTDGQPITRNSIPPVFKGNILTIYIVHGWMDSENSTWMHSMKDAFLKQGDYNVIIIGWSKGSQNIWYPQSASDTRAVGAEIALVINLTIADGGSKKELQYCVGHSLGAHVCGHAGNYGQINRITGLDPAGPLFEQRDISVGLNPSCAPFVDVIHTNGGNGLMLGAGTMRHLGHVDFYPNGGSEQPGCLDPFSGIDSNAAPAEIYEALREALSLGMACSHSRSHEYFAESILTDCFASRDVCTSEYLLPSFCVKKDQVVSSLGFYAITYKNTGIFYLETNSQSPFCKN